MITGISRTRPHAPPPDARHPEPGLATEETAMRVFTAED
jgi:hypothetical protein